MNSKSLENLKRMVSNNWLTEEPFDHREFRGMVLAGKEYLEDADNPQLSLRSRFNLVYEASHSLSLAALRWNGFRPKNRYHVFQTLQLTLEVSSPDAAVLMLGHQRRNPSSYEGDFDVNEKLVEDMLGATNVVLQAIEGLPDR